MTAVMEEHMACVQGELVDAQQHPPAYAPPPPPEKQQQQETSAADRVPFLVEMFPDISPEVIQTVSSAVDMDIENAIMVHHPVIRLVHNTVWV